MKANPLAFLIGVFWRWKLVVLQLLSILTAEVGLFIKQLRNPVAVDAGMKRRGKDSGGPRNGSRVIPRAERFAIETTIRFRNVGRNKWYEGKTENISGSGVLFRGKNLVPLRTRIEMIFALPNRSPGASSANVRCFGHTVRKAPPVGGGGSTGLAATIEEYYLMHAEGVSQA
jgi:hypothetical protein